MSTKINKKIDYASSKSYLYRKKILELSQHVGALHIGGSFSSVEILSLIYNLLKKKRDIFILSKGHCAILQYVILADKKIITNKFLKTYCQKNSKLGVHPDYGNPGIEASTGSLGHGLGIASGLALGNKNKIFVVISDGELMEGTTWEYLLCISSLKLNNIIVFVDYNGLQSATWSKDTHSTLSPVDTKFKSFGWAVANCNGNNINDIFGAFSKIKSINKPKAIICKTIKGYPVPFMSNVPHWHYKSPNKEEFKLALSSIKLKYPRKNEK